MGWLSYFSSKTETPEPAGQTPTPTGETPAPAPEEYYQHSNLFDSNPEMSATLEVLSGKYYTNPIYLKVSEIWYLVYPEKPYVFTPDGYNTSENMRVRELLTKIEDPSEFSLKSKLPMPVRELIVGVWYKISFDTYFKGQIPKNGKITFPKEE